MIEMEALQKTKEEIFEGIVSEVNLAKDAIFIFQINVPERGENQDFVLVNYFPQLGKLCADSLTGNGQVMIDCNTEIIDWIRIDIDKN